VSRQSRIGYEFLRCLKTVVGQAGQIKISELGPTGGRYPGM
jgi:hypothetical protein